MMRYCYSLVGTQFAAIEQLQEHEDVGFELRLDSLSEAPDAVGLRALTRRPLLATYRSKPHLGQADPAHRAGIGWDWRKACLDAGFEYIDLELDEPDLEARIAEVQAGGAKVVLSHHDLGDGSSLDPAIVRALASRADILKIVASGQGSACFVRQRDTYRRVGQRSLIHFAMGAEFAATRVLSLVLGAPFTFISPDPGTSVAPGQLSLEQMETWFHGGRQALARLKLFAVVGSPIAHSRSPRFHNPSLAAIDGDALFVALPAKDRTDLLRLLECWPELRGLAVTKPMKEIAHGLAQSFCDEPSAQLGAINTLLRDSDGWRGANTDLLAMIELLEELPPATVVRVLGHGGLGKAVVAAGLALGLAVEVSNRTPCPIDARATWVPWSDRHREGARVLVQATSVGMAPCADASPLDDLPAGIELMVETIYNPDETKWMKLGQEAGIRCVKGIALFEAQARIQNRLFAQSLPS